MAANDGFELEVYDDELGRYVHVPAPSAKPLAVRKKKAAQAKEPSAGDYLNTLGDVLFVNPRNSAAATLGGAAYDYAAKSTPQSVRNDIVTAGDDAYKWLRKENKAIRAAPITESLRLIKAGFIDPLADPYRVFKQAATERARGNETGGKKLAAMVPLAVAGVLPQGRGAGKLAVKAGTEAAETAAVKGATKTATKGAEKKAAMGVTPEPRAKKAPEPLAVYHGTSSSFERLDPSRAKAGLGTYVTPNKAFAEEFTKGDGRVLSGTIAPENVVNLSSIGPFPQAKQVKTIARRIGADPDALKQVYADLARQQGDVHMFSLLENAGVDIPEKTAWQFQDWGQGSGEPAYVFSDPNLFAEAATKGAEKKVVKAEPKPRKEKYQPVEPVENPHPELANVEFPEGSGRGGAFAVANQVPIVGRKPFIAQSKKGYSGLSGGLPANRVVANVKPFVDMPPRQFITPEDLAKDFNSIIPFTGDKLRGGTEILDIAGRPQEGGVRAYAGPDFARQQLGVGGKEVWASGPSVISGLENAAKEGQERFGGRVAGVYTTMGPEAADQSTAMIDLIGKQIAAGDIDPKDLAVFDDMVRNTTRKDDEAVRDFIGFGTNPLAAIDQLNDIGRTTMGQRRTVTQLMNSAPFLNAGFPDIGANRAGISTPELLYAPEGTSGYSISALEPGKGPLAPEDVSMQHPNYSHKLGGTYLGGFEVGVPRELVWSQLYNRPEMKQYEPFRQLSYLFGRAPKAIRQDLGYNPLIQPLDQEWVDNVSEYINAVKKFGPDGFAEGGLAVHPAQVSSSGLAVRR